jgi:hypothetical protein
MSIITTLISLLLVSQTGEVKGTVVNLLTGLEDSNNWLEAGFVSLRAGETVAVSSAGTFIKPVALLRYHTGIGSGTGTSYHTIPHHITL